MITRTHTVTPWPKEKYTRQGFCSMCVSGQSRGFPCSLETSLVLSDQKGHAIIRIQPPCKELSSASMLSQDICPNGFSPLERHCIYHHFKSLLPPRCWIQLFLIPKPKHGQMSKPVSLLPVTNNNTILTTVCGRTVWCSWKSWGPRGIRHESKDLFD